MLESLMCRVVEFDFNYEVAFTDYMRDLYDFYGRGRKNAENTSLDIIVWDDAYDGTPVTFYDQLDALEARTNEWNDPVSVLDPIPSAAVLSDSPTLGGSLADATVCNSGVPRVLQAGGKTSAIPPLGHEGPLGVLTSEEREALELWHRVGNHKDCAEMLGVSVRHFEYLVYHGRDKVLNGVRSEEEINQLKSTGAKKGQHVRWHVKRGIVKEGCEFCEKPSDTGGT